MWDERTKIGYQAFKSLQRFEVLTQVVEGKLTMDVASSIMSIGLAYAFQLLRAFKRRGVEGIIVRTKGLNKARPSDKNKYLFGERLRKDKA